jgi:L-aminopeptidase/D-esterase-like protein
VKRTSGRRSITDVRGVAVGHSEAGLTVLLPYPAAVARRKVWGAFRRVGRVGEVSGLHVLADFGALSSPIIFCPLTWFGSAYDALIAAAFRRDYDLSIDAGWPPLVFGISAAGDPDPRQPMPAGAVDEALAAAGNSFITGAVGAGRRWSSFDLPGGIGTASQATPQRSTVGVLAASNGGRREHLRGFSTAGAGPTLPPPAETSSGADSGAFALLVATDAALGPRSAGVLADHALLGLARTGALAAGAGAAALAFTTADPVDNAFTDGKHQVRRGEPTPRALAELCAAAAEAARGAVLDAVGLRP